MNRLIKPALILGASMLLFSHVGLVSADETDYEESGKITTVEETVPTAKEDETQAINLPDASTTSADTEERSIEFNTIYEPDVEAEPEEPKNVLAPAEPEEDKIDEIINNDIEVESPEGSELDTVPTEDETIESEVETEEPVEEDEASDDTSEESVEAPIEEDDAKSDEVPVLDEKGKITDEGINKLDDRVNSIMSEPIVKQSNPKKVKPQQSKSHTHDISKDEFDEFIIERMQKFLIQQSAFNTEDKIFVRELVVDRIIGKYMKPIKLPL